MGVYVYLECEYACKYAPLFGMCSVCVYIPVMIESKKCLWDFLDGANDVVVELYIVVVVRTSYFKAVLISVCRVDVDL